MKSKREIKRAAERFAERFAAYVLLASLALSMVGCGHNNIDYDVDSDSNENGSSSADGNSVVSDDIVQPDIEDSGDREGGMASKLGIPESCDESFDVGVCGADSIKCKVENIDVPESDSMKKMYYETNSYDADTVQKIVESLFDKEEGIYVRDDDVYTKDEIQDYIDSYDKQIQEAVENGNGEFVEELEQEKQFWQEKLNSAPDNLPAVTVYDPAGEYYGMHGGHEFTINFNNDGSSEMGSMGTSFSYKYTDKEKQKLAEKVEGATSMYVVVKLFCNTYG